MSDQDRPNWDSVTAEIADHTRPQPGTTEPLAPPAQPWTKGGA